MNGVIAVAQQTDGGALRLVSIKPRRPGRGDPDQRRRGERFLAAAWSPDEPSRRATCLRPDSDRSLRGRPRRARPYRPRRRRVMNADDPSHASPKRTNIYQPVARARGRPRQDSLCATCGPWHAPSRRAISPPPSMAAGCLLARHPTSVDVRGRVPGITSSARFFQQEHYYSASFRRMAHRSSTTPQRGRRPTSSSTYPPRTELTCDNSPRRCTDSYARMVPRRRSTIAFVPHLDSRRPSVDLIPT